MNPVIIILGIVMVVLIYILVRYFTVSSSTIKATASLKSANAPITSIENPTSMRYAYGVWVYINSWENTAKTIFSRDGNIKLYLERSAPVLKCDIVLDNHTPTARSISTMVITDNFPIQKWTYVLISVDSQFADAYLDGKLVKSHQIVKQVGQAIHIPKTPTDAPINLGNTGAGESGPFDAFLAKFKRWTAPVDPQTVWNSYMEGNGGNQLTKTLSSYGVNISVLKNSVEQSKFALF